MPPIILRLTPWLYIQLHSITTTAKEMTFNNCDNKQSMMQFPIVLNLADINVIHPHRIVFPKKGKRISLTLSQTVALHTTLKAAASVPTAKTDVLELLSLVDMALTNYNKTFGYKD